MSDVKEYHSFQDILKFLGFDYEFEKTNRVYPFNRGKGNVLFSWGQVLIPRYGIREIVQNKVSDIRDMPITELKMMYQIPFLCNGQAGMINKNISLTFRYDKEWKYGDITRSISECCFWILEHAERTNDFYIIEGDLVMLFFSYCVINNQWGLGSLTVSFSPNERMKELVRSEQDDLKEEVYQDE